MSHVRRVLTGLLLLVSMAACGSEPGTSADPASSPSVTDSSPAPTPRPTHDPDPSLQYEGDWVLVSGESPRGPIPIVEGREITLQMTARTANGRSTCNGYGGRFWITGDAFAVKTFGADQAGCPREPGAAVAEARYFRAFMQVDHVEVDEATLRLTGPEVELVYERVPAIDRAALVDTTWVSGDHTLRLSSDGTSAITYGCVVYVGTWTTMVGRVYFPETRLKEDCPDRGEGVSMDVTSGDFTVEIDGGRLTIRRGDDKVVYRAE